ncbi:hypothetical protein CVS40_6716 [Lucilia cuprina]|nr:hypothetical protein CVS40_6716 [Lucilia cuprina]
MNLSNFTCLNNGSPTFIQRFDIGNGTVPDISFINASFDILWRTAPIWSGGSHHFPIIMETDAYYPLTSSSKTWWNDSLASLFRRHVAARKKANQYPCPANLEDAIIAYDSCKSAVRLAKRQSYQRKIAGLNQQPNVWSAWRFIRNHLRDQVPNNVSMNLDCLATNRPTPFTIDDYLKVLESKRKPSAGGVDRVTYQMIHSLSLEAKVSLLCVLNEHFMNFHIHPEWRKVKIVPISKRNKALDDFRNFRPIALISVFVKIINLMLKRRLLSYMENMNCLPRRSFAYRKSMSTTTCLNEFIFRVSLLKSRVYNIVMATVDISSAYDCVNIKILRNILVDFDFPLDIIN